jgi:hypothetical protein
MVYFGNILHEINLMSYGSITNYTLGYTVRMLSNHEAELFDNVEVGSLPTLK